MSDKKEKNIVNVEGLGEIEIVRTPSFDKDGNAVAGVCSMSQKGLEQFYEDHGIPEAKKVMKAFKDANTALIEAAAGFLAPKVKEDKNDWELRAGIGNDRIIVGIDAVKKVRNVQTGETSEKYGTIYVKQHQKAPMTETLTKIAADLEAGLRA